MPSDAGGYDQRRKYLSHFVNCLSVYFDISIVFLLYFKISNYSTEVSILDKFPYLEKRE